jgi:hypothetical protein
VTLVAIRSFTDPSDGLPMTAGRTFVDESAAVARSHPQNFKPARGRTPRIVRSAGRRPRRARPAWLLETDSKPWRL